jgi:hypothetical protein
VVLEKDGFPPRIYIGRPINDRNLIIRTSQYVNMTGGLPKMIRQIDMDSCMFVGWCTGRLYLRKGLHKQSYRGSRGLSGLYNPLPRLSC